MTKIANKLFNEDFSDYWVWCNFWTRDQGLAFSIRGCSPALVCLSLAAPGSLGALRQGLGMEEEVEEGCPGGGLSKTAAKTPPWGALKCQV